MRIALLALTVFAASPALAAPLNLQVRDRAFIEVWRDRAVISMVDAVAGIAFRTATGGERPTVHALFPPDWRSSAVCARWLSSNGLYDAVATYDLNLEPRGDPSAGLEEVLVRLEYPTEHKEWLRDLTLEQLGITVSRGECNDPAEVFVPVIWNGPTIADGSTTPDIHELVILVNARGADETYAIVSVEEEMLDLDCQRLRGEDLVAIDHVCTIPLKALSEGRIDVEINRLRRGQPDVPVTLTIEWPDLQLAR